jgi:AraC-like DNA-binding protein
MAKKNILFFICSIVVIFSIQAQQEFQEQIDKLDFNTLYTRYADHYIKGDSIRALHIANAYFKKAKKIKDTNRIADGYYYRVLVDKQDRIDLYDSIIALTPGLKEQNQPTVAYLQKAYYHFYKLEYSKALDNYIKANKYNKGSNQENLEFDINLSIAELQIRIEENEKALKNLKKLWQKIITLDYKNENPHTYSRILLDLASVHRKLNQIDSSYTYIKLGIEINDNEQKEYNNYYHFLLLEGINDLKDPYKNGSNIKIDKAINHMNSIGYKENISLAYYYIGETYLKNGNEEMALRYFLKVDSFTNNSIAILPETLGSYKYLREYYSKKKDPDNELIYLKKIVTFDSILDINYKSINNKIKDKYELPILLESYNQKLTSLNQKNKKSKTQVAFLYSICGIILTVLLFFIFQRNKYKKRFKKLQESDFKKKSKQDYIPKEKPNIPEEVFIKVKDCLETFEKEEQFLNHTINSEKLAKQIGTNRPYFVKAYHYYKNESFNIYLRNLRLEYALERLKQDFTFRKYTIKTIAQESGFSNTESFSKYFYKKFGIYPSYYIKSLNNLSN